MSVPSRPVPSSEPSSVVCRERARAANFAAVKATAQCQLCPFDILILNFEAGSQGPGPESSEGQVPEMIGSFHAPPRRKEAEELRDGYFPREETSANKRMKDVMPCCCISSFMRPTAAAAQARLWEKGRRPKPAKNEVLGALPGLLATGSGRGARSGRIHKGIGTKIDVAVDLFAAEDEPTEHAPQPPRREDRLQFAGTSFTSSGSVHVPRLVGAMPRLSCKAEGSELRGPKESHGALCNPPKEVDKQLLAENTWVRTDPKTQRKASMTIKLDHD
ncbi:unnamed protein product [Symbiodinium sp. CCMP2592]|nr:unnamed protein product [Symbiodinium sp. CCMP2592]